MQVVSSNPPLNVLFLCTGNSARSIMAEAILNRLGARQVQGLQRRQLAARAISIPMRSRCCANRISTSRSCARSPGTSSPAPGAPKLDFVFTVCDDAAKEVCPIWPGQPMTAHWGLPDPAKAQGNRSRAALAFADGFRMLYQRISIFVSLPFDKLSKLSLQKHLDEIGQTKAAVTKQSA